MKHIYLNENKLSLLTEISIKDKYEKESQMGKTKLSFEDFEFLCNLDPTSKPNQVGKYANWILAKYVPNTDWNQLKRCLEWYADGIKRNIIKQLNISTDINSFKTYEEFINVINQVSESNDAQISNSEYNNRTKLKGQFELMGSTSFYDIIKPLTYNAERYLGSHTEWCTVANNTYFDSYMEDGPLYIIYPKNGDDEMKMQFHFESSSFSDKYDNVARYPLNCINDVIKDENIKKELLNLCIKLWGIEFWRSQIELKDENGNFIIYDREEGKYNLINSKGNLLFSNQWFDEIDIVGGYYKVELNYEYYLFNKDCILMFNQPLDNIEEIGIGLLISFDGKYNIINHGGHLLFPNQWIDNVEGALGCYIICYEDKYNIIDYNGELLSPKQWFYMVDTIGVGKFKVYFTESDYEEGEYFYLDDESNLYDANKKLVKNLQTENVKKYQQQLIKESYKDFSITNIESIYYQINEETDEFEESYDVNAYDYDGNTIFEEYELSSFDLYRMLGETIGNKIINHEGHYNQMNNNYHLMSDDFQTYEFKDANDAAKQLFNQSLTEYYPNLHGYIMTDGECIDLGYNDHNTITRIPDINDKFEFIALGNIRCSNSTFDLIQPPTYEQKQCLRKLIANSVDLSVDIFDENGTYPLTSVMYRGKVEPSIVLGQIDRFFREGIKLNPNVDNYDDDDYLYENYNFEYKEDDVDMSSFEKQTSLQQDLWDSEDKLNSRARLKLLDIADDFIETLGISWVKPIDIILTGSLCNYNWSSYSDVDLHIIIDFAEINKKKQFVEEYFKLKKNEWNESHQDLKIYGFNVELFVEDVENDSVRDGVYSLEKNVWVKKPFSAKIQPISDTKEKKIKYLASIALTKIEDLEDEFNEPYDEVKLEKLSYKIDRLLDTLKKVRQEGLNKKGEMSVGNIIYKICRRTGYLDKLWDLKNKVYDKKNSLN